ncbi:P-loop containing nucleoside triphosphate hydrolase protein [Rhodofomes roseus]|uniref:P-loop containing nucleoside triphosphate hydrolase protein n=1 Tax=Rhodofomes roseus TaxID=34475 RepID=A0ABQ8JYI7_9APHY|nr:P-loop containing nucleoside triphosphate hydrolase protein [Rhodofomes roseus]KAH9829041.1 P-loop containing nucleoside triphosphate hydrolase protein [Rhodofomes roseus]
MRVCVPRRAFSAAAPAGHDNPLGLPARNAPPPLPRRGLPPKRPIPHAAAVLAVASGKGGVGKSTVAVNLAVALAMHRTPAGTRPRVGILDLDIFGPSVPKLMGLDRADEPRLTPGGALVPLINHGLPCMSMGFLLPRPPGAQSSDDSPVVWRGLMVQKAVQQLLFDVDWRDGPDHRGPGLDLLVLDMPPGTGDVPLTLGQLVTVDGALIVSTPQDVALSDVRKGAAMFRKLSVPILGLLLNQAFYTCPSCAAPHHLYGPPDPFRATAARLGAPVLGELPVAPGVSTGGDAGVPYVLLPEQHRARDPAGWDRTMSAVAERVWAALSRDGAQS